MGNCRFICFVRLCEQNFLKMPLFLLITLKINGK